MQRSEKGIILAVNSRIYKVHEEDAWLVESSSQQGKYYKVREDGVCECQDSQYGNICKHFWGVLYREIS